MSIVIIDYGSGNLHSTLKAFEHVAKPLGLKVSLTKSPAALGKATHIVLPGVGAFADCMRGIEAISGMREALEENVQKKKKPFLGICVGMQLLAEKGLEHGEHKGLGWLKSEVSAIKPKDASFKIPHMGWNDLQLRKKHALLAGIESGKHAYFVHSYAMRCANAEDVLATVDYAGEVVAVVGRGNIMGTQFHPEKSQETGLALIGNFLQMEQAA
jgi:glutamine amidotransferase